MYQLIDVIVGALLAFFFIRSIHRFAPERERLVYAVGLVFAALVYVGFTLVNKRSDRLGLEAIGVLVFAMIAAVGFISSAVLGLGWISHAAWDYSFGTEAEYVPFWYPAFCIGFDIFLGAYILLFLTRRTKEI